MVCFQAAVLLCLPSSTGAQTLSNPATNAYVCTDGRGRTLSSDRPLSDCLDREQRELRRSGGTLRKIGPTYTTLEQEANEERLRREELHTAQRTEDRRRMRALLTRYPNAAAHQRERSALLGQIDEVLRTASVHRQMLLEDRVNIQAQWEFFTKAGGVPHQLQAQATSNAHGLAVQDRFIADQREEKQRQEARFDRESALLTPLWAASR